MKFYQSLSLAPVDQLEPLARAAADLGFTGVSLGDHLAIPNDINSTFPYGDGVSPFYAGGTWPDPLIAIAAMAHVSDELRFLISVYLLPLRQPVLAAKSIATTACLTNDRLTVGVGSGWMKEEFDLAGREFRNRGSRLDEEIGIVRALCTGSMGGYEGRHYRLPAVQMQPAPSEPVPFYVGGHSEAALRRAARTNGWIAPLQDDPAQLLRYIETLNAYRDPANDSPFDIVITLKTQPDVGVYLKLRDAGMTTVIAPSFMLASGDHPPDADGRAAEMRRFADTYFEELST